MTTLETCDQDYDQPTISDGLHVLDLHPNIYEYTQPLGFLRLFARQKVEHVLQMMEKSSDVIQ